MDSRRILLLNPKPSAWYIGFASSALPAPPLGLLYVAAQLRASGYRVDLVDMVAEKYTKDDLSRYIDTRQPIMIGLSCATEAINTALRMCDFIKVCSPGTFTVLGGAHPTFEYRHLIAQPGVDFVIRHEGELALVQLLDELQQPDPHLENVKGLCWKNRGSPVVNEDRPFIEDLDTLPFPARDLIKMEKYAWPGSIASSRGCPFSCIFCAAGAMSGGHYRCRSINNVFTEMEHMVLDLGIRDFLFVDDTFTAHKTRTVKLCEKIIQAQWGITFSCESRVNSIDADFLDILKAAGCERIQFGIESGSDDVLRKIQKGITTAQIRKAVDLAHKAGLKIKGSFILGHVWDTRETLQATCDLMRQLNETYDVELYPAINIPFPGTTQYEAREKLGIELITEDWDDFYFGNAIIDTPNLTHIDLRNCLFEISQYLIEANKKLRQSQA